MVYWSGFERVHGGQTYLSFSTSVSFYPRWDPVERTDFLCIVLCEMDTFKMEPYRRVSVESTWSSGIKERNVPVAADIALYHGPWRILFAYTVRPVFGFALGPWSWDLGGGIELLLEVAFCIFMLACPLGLLPWA